VVELGSLFEGGYVLYCFKCSVCGNRFESTDRETSHCGVQAVRDYHAEGVGIGSGVRVSRDGTLREQAELFLPTNRDFAGPDDPDGRKGAREWLETHAPKHPGGKNPNLEF
jgi:hypothetical protein